MYSRTSLDGVRVLDLGRAWAGPLAGKMLGDLGAEVIAIEASNARGDRKEFEHMKRMWQAGRHLDLFPDGDPGEQPWNREGLVNDLWRNKLGIVLDLSKPRGRDIFKELVKKSDVVLENYTPRVMKNFGLDYPVLKEINDRIIMLSMPGYGMYGPYRDYPAFGTTLEQHAGFSSIMGYPDSGPYRTQSTYPDPASAVNAASAILLALLYRQRTQKGQYIDLAQIEASTCLLGEVIMGYTMNRRAPRRLGNRHQWMAPHGCYRCRGGDGWLAIAVANDGEWNSLCRVMGNPAWTKESRFGDQLGRWQNQDEMDKLIAAWTVCHNHYEAMQMLQKAGVAAGAVLDSAELVTDPQLTARDYFVETFHPQAGTHIFPGLAIKLSRTPASFRRPSPLLGEHSDYVLRELLGLSEQAIAELRKDRVIGDGPPVSEPT